MFSGRATQILKDQAEALESLAQVMLEYETLSGEEIKQLLESGKIDRPSDLRGPLAPRPISGSAIPKAGRRFSGPAEARPGYAASCNGMEWKVQGAGQNTNLAET